MLHHASANIGYTGGASIGTETSGPISVSYDASTRSYSLSANGVSKTFQPSNQNPRTSPGQLTPEPGMAYIIGTLILPSGGGLGLDIYNLESHPSISSPDDKVEHLMLSNNENPIIASTQTGPADITLTYTGFGAWMSGNFRLDNGPSVKGNITYFTYGAYTSDADVPRLGSGTYRIAVDARLFSADAQYIVVGHGGLSADFSTGDISFSSSLSQFRPSALSFVGGGSSISGSAKIDSTRNEFVGSFSFQGMVDLPGKIIGRFYGPQAEEVGATLSGSTADGILVGALVGSQTGP